MERAWLDTVAVLLLAPVSFASSKTQTVNTEHQFHFSSANKSVPNLKNEAHYPPVAAGRQSRPNAKTRRYAANPPIGKLGFVSATQIAAGGDVIAAAIGDFNGDGNEDLAAIVGFENGGFALSVLLGKGDGTFQTPVLKTVTESCPYGGIVAADLNGDKKDDIILIVVNTAGDCEGTSSFDVFLSNGDGTLAQGNNYTISPNVVVGGGLYVTTNSGHLDVVAVVQTLDNAPSSVVTVLGNGDGTFSNTPTSVSLSGPVGPAVLADLNGDGILDVAALYSVKVGPAWVAGVIVYLATSPSAYASGAVVYTPQHFWDGGPCGLTIGDLNDDGYPEIVAPNCNNNVGQGYMTVFLNNKDGSYQTGVYYNGAVGGVQPVSVTIADVNGDGKADIISANGNSSDITILTGNGDGTFNVPTVGYAAGGTAMVADFDGDGYPDLVVPSGGLLLFLKGYGDGTFRAAGNYYVPLAYGGNSIIDSGDFNGDGVPDIVVGAGNLVGGNEGVLATFLSTPDGRIQPSRTFFNFNYDNFLGIFGPAVADFNRDGTLDVAGILDEINVLSLTGNGDGTFTTGSILTSVVGPDASDLVAADFNGDGYPDLAILNENPLGNSSVSILLNDRAGNFSVAETYLLSSGSNHGIAAADLNADGNIDLLVPYVGGQSDSVAMLLGNGDGTLQSERDISLSGLRAPQAITVADLNNDGNMDIIAALANGNGQDIAILWGTGVAKGVPTFLSMTVLSSSLRNGSPGPQYVRVTDIDGDGNLDLVYPNEAYGSVGVIFGAGNGTFFSPVEYPVSGCATNLVVADLDDDGAPDVAVTSCEFAGVTVLHSASGRATMANYIVASNPASTTVTAGSSANFTLTITPNNQYNGTITLSCGTLPSLATCTFKPTSIAMDGNNVETVTLTISTAAASTPSSSDLRRIAFTPREHPAMLLAGIGGLGLIGLMFVGGCVRRNRWGGVALGMVVIAVLFWLACGGGSSNRGGKAATTTTVASSNTRALVGSSVTFTGTVAAVSGSPTGTVSFLDGTTNLGTHAVSSGTATFQTSSLAAGVHNITASYDGDSNFNSSTSTGLNQTVQNPGTPAGTYRARVTAIGSAGTHNGNTSTHSVNLTLTVQ